MSNQSKMQNKVRIRNGEITRFDTLHLIGALVKSLFIIEQMCRIMRHFLNKINKDFTQDQHRHNFEAEIMPR